MISWCCAVAPFTVEDRSLINELRFEDIGTERKAAILEQTFDSRRKWVVQCRPSFGDYFLKFPPLKDMGIHVSSYDCLRINHVSAHR